MSQPFARMPLEQQWWAISGIHHPEDAGNLIDNYVGEAARVVHLLSDADARTADPFLEGAQQAMRKYRAAGRGHKVMGGSNCRFAELKEGDKPTTFFIIADANAMTAQGDLIALVQWCMTQEIKRHPNKHRPVFLLADEASNFKIDKLRSLITYARGYGLRLHLFLQNFSAFRDAYDQETLNTLLSEAEIQQFLPGTREPEILQYIQAKLGEQSVVVRRRRGGRTQGQFQMDSVDYSEEARPLMTAAEIALCDKAILFIRRHLPALVDVLAYAAIHPWRVLVGIDPHHGKPFRLRVKLRLKRRGPPLLSRLKSLLRSSKGDT